MFSKKIGSSEEYVEIAEGFNGQSSMSSDASNDFFWQEMQSNDSGSELQIQRITLEGLVGTTDQEQTIGLQAEDTSSPSGLVSTNSNNITDSPSSTSQAVLPIGVINPDAIIPQTRSYTCRICQVTFPNKSAVTVHSRIHTNHEGKPYRCSFCHKGFSTNFYLKQHERIHNGQKPYKCPMCEQSFKQLSHVQQHVRTHTGVRPYKCHWPGCGKAFLQQSHLKSHIARHSPKQNNGVRPYKCHWPDCGKSFAQISNLKSHIARHTPKPKTPKNAAGAAPSVTVVTEQRPGGMVQEKQEVPELTEGASLMSPDVIGQAAAAANIVPSQVQLGADYESICPFLCPGCSKLYVREATFKKHLEECKTKLQMSISATAAALGIEPPPLPSPTGQVTTYVHSDGNALAIEMGVAEDQGHGGEPAKKSRKISKQSAMVEASRQRQLLEIVEMPMDVIRADSTAHLSDSALAQDGGVVKQEMVNMTLDGGSSGGVMFRLPQHILNAVGVTEDAVSGVDSGFSYSPVTTHMLDGGFLSGRHHMTVSSAGGSDNSSMASVSSAQSLMISGASVDETDNGRMVTAKTENDRDGHSTINPSALRWQWDQPAQPRMNFP